MRSDFTLMGALCPPKNRMFSPLPSQLVGKSGIATRRDVPWTWNAKRLSLKRRNFYKVDAPYHSPTRAAT